MLTQATAAEVPAPLILVVEDDAGAATLQRKRLQRAGFRVEVATDNDTAMRVLASGGVSLTVIDYRLGPTTGLDLHRRMKASGFDVPVIVVSGALDDSTVIEAMRSGVRDVVVKNGEYLDYLPEAVTSVLTQTASAREFSADDKPGCVLIVDDDIGIATLERRNLQRAGYDVVVATSADEAAAIVHKGKVSVALIDLRLGNVSGLDLYESLKAEGWDVPAILVTAFPDQTVAIRALRAGIKDFVPKTADYLDYLPRAVDRVTAQLRLERKLVDSEVRLASIVATAMDTILMCDERLRVVLFNRAAEEMFARSADEALKCALPEFIPDAALIQQLLERVGHRTGEFKHRRELDAVGRDGQTIPVEVSVSEVPVNGKQLFTVIARDISERRRTETELREADRRKDQFLGMLAHELRNPLAAISNATEALSLTLKQPGTEKLTMVLKRQTKALARMVDDLLDVSRVTLGKIQLSREPLLVSQVVSRSAENVREIATRAGLTIETHIDAEPIWIVADYTRLEQVLVNLLNNAIKFTPNPGRIIVEARRENERAVITVSDTGIGMDASLTPRVFDLFVQGDTSLDRAKSGLGIGLALVRQIVLLHGGEVIAASDGLGHGSRFTIAIPAASDDLVGSSSDPDLSAARPTASLRLVVVDDQPDVAESIAALLSALGHHVRVCHDGAEALALSADEVPDAMFIDVGMPGLTGYDLARQLRRDPRLGTTKLIALTGYTGEQDRLGAIDAGFDLHLSKPASPEKLRAALHA